MESSHRREPWGQLCKEEASRSGTHPHLFGGDTLVGSLKCCVLRRSIQECWGTASLGSRHDLEFTGQALDNMFKWRYLLSGALLTGKLMTAYRCGVLRRELAPCYSRVLGHSEIR